MNNILDYEKENKPSSIWDYFTIALLGLIISILILTFV